jgi:hypothetical protein
VIVTERHTPTLRRVGILVTDTEWRALRMAAAVHDTSIQGYVTTAVLRRLQGEDRQSWLDAASDVDGGREAD